MRPVGILLIIGGFLGLAYYTFTFMQWHEEQLARGPLPAIILTNDRVCGCITSGVAALIGGMLLLLAALEQGFNDFRRQLNDIHTTFNHANKTVIEQNDGVIRNATDLKREREALKEE